MEKKIKHSFSQPILLAAILLGTLPTNMHLHSAARQTAEKPSEAQIKKYISAIKKVSGRIRAASIAVPALLIAGAVGIAAAAVAGTVTVGLVIPWLKRKKSLRQATAILKKFHSDLYSNYLENYSTNYIITGNKMIPDRKSVV